MEEALEVFLVMMAVSSPFLVGMFIAKYFDHRSKIALIGGEKTSLERENAELKMQLENMRERIEVLEAIVTDPRHDLGRKISGL